MPKELKSEPIKKGDFVKWRNKSWKVFTISNSGLVTLQNITKKIPASIVTCISSVKLLKQWIRVIKN